MSGPARTPVELETGRATHPEFELDFDVDDQHEPSAVTIHDPQAADVTTYWLTVDAAWAIDLAAVA